MEAIAHQLNQLNLELCRVNAENLHLRQSSEEKEEKIQQLLLSLTELQQMQSLYKLALVDSTERKSAVHKSRCTSTRGEVEECPQTAHKMVDYKHQWKVSTATQTPSSVESGETKMNSSQSSDEEQSDKLIIPKGVNEDSLKLILLAEKTKITQLTRQLKERFSFVRRLNDKLASIYEHELHHIPSNSRRDGFLRRMSNQNARVPSQCRSYHSHGDDRTSILEINRHKHKSWDSLKEELEDRILRLVELVEFHKHDGNVVRGIVRDGSRCTGCIREDAVLMRRSKRLHKTNKILTSDACDRDNCRGMSTEAEARSRNRCRCRQCLASVKRKINQSERVDCPDCEEDRKWIVSVDLENSTKT